MSALLALTKDEVSWPIRIAVRVVLLVATLLLYLDQRNRTSVDWEA